MHIPTKSTAKGAATAIAVTQLNYGLITGSSKKVNKGVPIQVTQNDGSMRGPKSKLYQYLQSNSSANLTGKYFGYNY